MKHRKAWHLGVQASAAVALAAAMPLAAGAVDRDTVQERSVAALAVTDRLVVKYRDARPGGKGLALVRAIGPRRQAIVERAGQQFGVIVRPSHTTAAGANVFRLDRKMAEREVEALAAELAARDPEVEYAEPDRRAGAASMPNDPGFAQQWNYFEADAGLRLPQAWDKSTGAGVNIAVIDTGYLPHADLAGQVVQGYDFIRDAATAGDGDGRDNDARDPGDWVAAGQCGAGSAPSDSSWHGTHVSGIAAARTNNQLGVAGVAFGAKIVPARVLGKCGGWASDMADAIAWASGGAVDGVPQNANKARVINMSISAFASAPCPAYLQGAIDGALSRGTVVVVAAGNRNVDAGAFWPANCKGVVAVAAVARDGGKASYSNYGSVVTVAAPGGDLGDGILSTLNAGRTVPGADNYVRYMGTSMAAPHVAGTVALMLAKNPALAPGEVASRLKSSARQFAAACADCGAGLVDANAAVMAAAPPAPAPVQDEVESNETMSTANAVATSGTIVRGAMASSTDNDYFSVRLAPGQALSATLTANSRNADYDLFVYDSDGAPLVASQNGPGSVDAVSVVNNSQAEAVRYLRVRYYAGGTGSAGGRYTLRLAW